VLPNVEGAARGVIVLVAGGPGQGSAHTFDLGAPANAAFYRSLFPGYTLVAYDDRGTGSSGVLRCPGLENAASTSAAATLVAACANAIGPSRDFYGTADHVEDLEAVRQALGVERIAIWGVSYGTKLALAYASAYPEHVERLLLDSVVPPDQPDTFASDAFQSMPATLAAYCADRACRAATPDYAADVSALANRLAAAPLQGTVLLANGKTTLERLGADEFVSLVFATDLSPGLAAELPAAVRAARQGNPRPLLRTFQLATTIPGASALDMSLALYLATACDDGPFPWQPDTPIVDRPATVQTALAALPPGSFGPFGTWAQELGTTSLCLDWPSPSGGATLNPHPLPDVPVLALGGGLDLRTPTTRAADVIAQFPQGHLLLVPGVGHSVLTTDPSNCAQQAVRKWLIGETPPTSCPRPKPYLTPAAAFPTLIAKRLDAQQTIALAAKTLHEAEAIWLMTATSDEPTTIPGLEGGKLFARESDFTLDRYSIGAGLALTGAITITSFGPPVQFNGFIIVNGTAAVPGILRVNHGQLHAELSH